MAMKVLIIEKDKTVRQSFSTSWSVTEIARSFLRLKEGWNLSLPNIPFDVVLCGDRLPDGSGLEMLRSGSIRTRSLSQFDDVQSDDRLRQEL